MVLRHMYNVTMVLRHMDNVTVMRNMDNVTVVLRHTDNVTMDSVTYSTEVYGQCYYGAEAHRQ
jgi:hypothetical protein